MHKITFLQDLFIQITPWTQNISNYMYIYIYKNTFKQMPIENILYRQYVSSIKQVYLQIIDI